MPLKILRAEDPITVDHLNVVIYGQPGVGKTTLGFTADDPLLLDFDNGVYRAAIRDDNVKITQWSDVASMTKEDLAPYKTVVIDTIGRALDVLTADIIAQNPKMGSGDGQLGLKGWGVLKVRFTSFLKQLNTYGVDVVMLAHLSEDGAGDDKVVRLDVQGSSKQEVYKTADAMGRIIMATKDTAELRFSPSDVAFGKNPGQLPPLKIPHFTDPAHSSFLGTTIRQIKDKLNQLSDEQAETLAEQNWFRDTLPKVSNAAGINQLLGRAENGGQGCLALLKQRAREMGLRWDKAAGKFGEPVMQEAAE